METVIVTDEEIVALTQAILRRHGIDFTCYEPKSLRRRVLRAISVLGLSSIHELWTKILKEPGFIHLFMDEISVGLTSMFRDPLLWKSLRRSVPKMSLQSNQMNIWHAGCSTGEEVYTMGILLKELNLQNKYKALATDISQEAMNVARTGRYHKIKMVEYEKNYNEYNNLGQLYSYAQRMDNMALLSPSLIQNVQFRYHNLITDPFDKHFNIIFCRNVMIYFDNDAKIKLISKFHEALSPGGLFIIGFYDALIPLVDPRLFELIDLEAKIFRAIK